MARRAEPGGNAMPAADYRSGAKGDGHGRPIKGRGKQRGRQPDARTFGQDLMRGEHVVGQKKAEPGLTWVGGNRTTDDLDETSQKILEATVSGTSIFDPVLCELAYRWFCPPGGMVLDPFAGGSVRGITAAKLGRAYVGIELRPEQIAANQTQADRILGADDVHPEWLEGDSREMDSFLPGNLQADFLFTCPPYYDLELYSDDPRDLSNMPWPEFLDGYRQIIALACARLAQDRFAVWVVGDVRDPQGYYRGLPWRTVQAFEDAGLHLYNEAALVTAVGSLPLRTRMQFEASRKLGKTHQNVLVFVKGDPRKAAQAIGKVQFGEGEGPADEESGDPTPSLPDIKPVTDPTFTTPWQQAEDGPWIKRDDAFDVLGQRGGKARTCLGIATAPGPALAGLVTASSRSSPQAGIVAAVAAHLGVPARCHMPTGAATAEMARAKALGAELIQHSPGHNSVIIARAREDAEGRSDWRLVPFGMECQEAVRRTAQQVAGMPDGVQRIVVAVGSGMSLAGILSGLKATGRQVPVLGVCVGANPMKRLDRWAPGWRETAKLLFDSKIAYHEPAARTRWWGIELDPYYEAKAAALVQPGDAFWIVGCRATVAQRVSISSASNEVAKVNMPPAKPTQHRPLWKISAAWLGKNHDCTLAGILKRCHGGCCRSKSYWPPKVGVGSVCPKLGDKGCTLGDRRPVTCMLYPLVVNANNTLVLHQRTTLPTSCCKGNHGQGPLLVDALGESLTRIFGEAAYARIRAGVVAGRDVRERPQLWAIEAMERERTWAEAGVAPEPLPVQPE